MKQEFYKSNSQEVSERRASLDRELDKICEVIEGFALPLRYLLRLLLFVTTTCVALLAAAALHVQGMKSSQKLQGSGSQGLSQDQYDSAFALAHLLLLPRQGVKDSVFFFISVFEIFGARIVRPGELRYLSKAPNQLIKQVAFLFWRVFSLVLKAAHLLPHVVPGAIVRLATRIFVLACISVLMFFSSFVSALLNGVAALLHFQILSVIFVLGSACAFLGGMLGVVLVIRQLIAVCRALIVFVHEVSQEVRNGFEQKPREP